MGSWFLSWLLPVPQTPPQKVGEGPRAGFWEEQPVVLGGVWGHPLLGAVMRWDRHLLGAGSVKLSRYCHRALRG